MVAVLFLRIHIFHRISHNYVFCNSDTTTGPFFVLQSSPDKHSIHRRKASGWCLSPCPSACFSPLSPGSFTFPLSSLLVESGFTLMNTIIRRFTRVFASPQVPEPLPLPQPKRPFYSNPILHPATSPTHLLRRRSQLDRCQFPAHCGNQLRCSAGQHSLSLLSELPKKQWENHGSFSVFHYFSTRESLPLWVLWLIRMRPEIGPR